MARRGKLANLFWVLIYEVHLGSSSIVFQLEVETGACVVRSAFPPACSTLSSYTADRYHMVLTCTGPFSLSAHFSPRCFGTLSTSSPVLTVTPFSPIFENAARLGRPVSQSSLICALLWLSVPLNQQCTTERAYMKIISEVI